MSTMRMTVLTMLLTVGAFSALLAQPGQGRGAAFREMAPEERARMQTNRLTESLQLDTVQAEAVYDIYLQHAQSFQQMQENTALSREEKMALGQEARAAQNEAIKAVLTEEQQQQFDEMQQNRRQGRGRPGGGGR
ncbi:MAG: hypothetical protein KDC54_22290 [Lewinella sp.]|nr:hypothetical protein [Lewinella sp.]